MPFQYDPTIHHRRSIRLRDYDYAWAGAYFVTICAYQRRRLFGRIVDGEMVLNPYGEIVWACWHDLPTHFPHVELDAFVVMPNHVHGIIVIVEGKMDDPNVGAQHAAPLQVKQGSLGAIVRSFKSATTKRINELRGTPGAPIWQRNYYEHIIRNEKAFAHIQGYILNNPANWDSDMENPNRTCEDDFDRWLKEWGKICPKQKS